MDNNFYLCDKPENALVRSSSLFDDHSLVGLIVEEFIYGVYEELEKVSLTQKMTATKTRFENNGKWKENIDLQLYLPTYSLTFL